MTQDDGLPYIGRPAAGALEAIGVTKDEPIERIFGERVVRDPWYWAKGDSIVARSECSTKGGIKCHKI